MTELETIQKTSGAKTSSCSCATCKEMCSRVPCLGTPEDMQKLIDHGYKDRLKPSLWMVAVMMGHQYPIAMVTPAQLPDGGCTFLTPEGLCELHESGLKPTEGKLAHHDPIQISSVLESPNFLVARTWIRPENEAMALNIFQTVSGKEDPY